jgi:hypothetical protein
MRARNLKLTLVEARLKYAILTLVILCLGCVLTLFITFALVISRLVRWQWGTGSS